MSDIPDRFAEYEGKEVQVFLYSGAVLRGRATFDGDWVNVARTYDDGKEKTAICNLSHVISISRV